VNGLMLYRRRWRGVRRASAASPAGDKAYLAFAVLMVTGLVLGVTSVMPIGGGDMPVVISLLNSSPASPRAAAGFIILNNVLIVAGCLVGASGIILTQIMCKAMNRSLANVLFSGFGSGESGGRSAAVTGELRSPSARRMPTTCWRRRARS
jgi:NAD(P) transhydrogenase subunit beta